jgi:DNA-binding MarR family transcriptional regulator
MDCVKPTNAGDALNLKLVVVVTRAMRRLFVEPRQRLKERGLTPAQFAVLELLHHKGAQRIGEIQEKILTTAGNMTVVLANLNKAGWVEQRLDPKDGRASLVHLTQEGKALIGRVFPEHVEALRTNLAVLSYEEKRTVVTLLKKVGKQ